MARKEQERLSMLEESERNIKYAAENITESYSVGYGDENEDPHLGLTDMADVVDKPEKKNNNKTVNTEDEFPDLTQQKRWPQWTSLVKKYPVLVIKMLKAVDDCGATKEPNASNSDNVKGNKWDKLFDLCFGGNRGLLSPHLSAPINASKYKNCIGSIWLLAEGWNDTDESIDK